KYFKHQPTQARDRAENFDSLVTASSAAAKLAKYRRDLLSERKRSQRRRIAGPLMRAAAGAGGAEGSRRCLLLSYSAAQFETVDRRPGEQLTFHSDSRAMLPVYWRQCNGCDGPGC
ncbi:hypothetical protein C8A01DRAFT_13323, partial [Parachaetomium inaequale]